MIHQVEDQMNMATGRRLLAVVAGDKFRAQEVAACFAEQGDRVKAIWYPDTRQLLQSDLTSRFEAVILFGPEDEALADAEEAEVRGVLRHTPLYRL